MTVITNPNRLKSTSFSNREKFIRKYKDHLKSKVKTIIDTASIGGFDLKGKKVKIKLAGLDVPDIKYRPDVGEIIRVYPGNKKFTKGSKVPKPTGEGGGTAGGPSGNDNDDFDFTLTSAEFANLFFDDLELPNFVKQTLTHNKYELKRAGFCKKGNPALLNIKKTMLNSIARRTALKVNNPTYQPAFLIEDDLRYNYKTLQEIPDTKAVMFCLLDVSGSMGEFEKDLAKRFFLLLNLFLNKHYDQVEVVFVRHTETAEEVSEKEFFYGTKSGGTIMSSGYEVINSLINQKYSANDYNIYIAQASDGGNWVEDTHNLMAILSNAILPKAQYLFYIHVSEFEYVEDEVFPLFDKLKKQFVNMSYKKVRNYKEIYPVFRSFFEVKKT